MDYLPIFVDLKQQSCLVVGGGNVAARKAALLVKAKASVTVVAPSLGEHAAAMLKHNEINWLEACFKPQHVDGRYLVIAATDDELVNKQVYLAARDRKILVNVVDRTELCDFILPSVLDRSPVVVAVSSAGASPVLARSLRARLESLISPAYSRLGKLTAKYRKMVKDRFVKSSQRRRFWESVLEGEVANHVFAGRTEQAEQCLLEKLSQADESRLTQGEVYLVGAGPGDPDLLTFKALRLMQQADVVFYDRLVSKEILALVRREAELIYVGKQRDWHAVRQEEINQLLLEQAQQGKRVLRLKGGDPFIFGRGGEEIDTLAQHHILFQVVPGITAASGCACYAGIPLTHRDYAQSVTFVTGHLQQGELDLNWSSLVQPNQTIVVYMGLAGLPQLSQKLIENGMSATKPAALIQQGTTDKQKVWNSTIAELPALAEKEQPVAPTLVIIGEVTCLQQKFSWSGG